MVAVLEIMIQGGDEYEAERVELQEMIGKVESVVEKVASEIPGLES